MGCYEFISDTADTDGDSMPDGWELNHSLDPTDDTDADGNLYTDPHSNLQEFIALTNPSDYFRITIVSNLPWTIYFESSSNRLYSMLGCSNLVNGTWTNVFGAGPRVGVGGADTMQDTNVPA